MIEQLLDGRRQVFLTTHSPVFINVAKPKSLYQVALRDGLTDVRQILEQGDLSRLLSDASLGPRELAALLGRTEVLIYKYLQGVHLPRLEDLPELAQALNLKCCKDLIPQEWCDPER